MDDSDKDQRLEHHLDPEEYINMEDLFKSTGVEYFKVFSTLLLKKTYKILIIIHVEANFEKCQNLWNLF